MSVAVQTREPWKPKSESSSAHEYFVHTVCRLCSGISGNLVPIFNCIDKKNNAICAKLKKCLPSISVQETDVKPKQICVSCISRLDMCFEFIEMSLDSDKKFDSLVESKDILHPQLTAEFNWSENRIKEEEITVEGLISREITGYSLQQQQEAFMTINKPCDTGQNVFQSLISHDNTMSQDFVVLVEVKCKDYPELTGKQYPLSIKRTDTRDISSSADITSKNSPISDFLCFDSKSVDNTIGDCDSMIIELPPNTGDSEIQNSSPFLKSLESNIVNTSIKHNGLSIDDITTLNSLYPKQSADMVTEEYNDIQRIMKNPESDIKMEALDDVSTSAAVCITRPVNEKQFDAPQSTSRNFTCPVCGKQFTRRNRLNAHVARHSSERPHCCDKCDQRFITRWDLTLHLRIHSGMFACEYCGKAFPAKGKLERHRRTHTGERPYPCDLCTKAFSEKRNLENHLRTHTGEQPFACIECGRTFRLKTHLIDHQIVHINHFNINDENGQLKLKCNCCNKTYKSRRNYELHMKTHSTLIDNDVRCSTVATNRTISIAGIICSNSNDKYNDTNNNISRIDNNMNNNSNNGDGCTDNGTNNSDGQGNNSTNNSNSVRTHIREI